MKAISRALLAALFAAFLSTQSLATDYYVSNAGSGSTCSMASPCDQIADINGKTLNPGDNVFFNRGDSFGDAILDADQAGSEGGGCVTYGAFGTGNKPEIGSTSLLRAIDVSANYVCLDNLHVTKTSGGSSTTGMLYVTGNNFTWTDVDLTGASAGENNVDCAWIEGTGYSIDTGTVTDCNTTGIRNTQGASGTISNITFNDCALGSVTGQGDNLNSASPWTGTITTNNLVFDMEGSTTCENNSDHKGSGTWVHNNPTYVESRQSSILVQHQTDVTINDGSVTCTGGTGRCVFISRLTGTGCASLTVNRTKFIADDTTDEMIRVGDNSGDECTLNINASAFIAESGTAALARFLQIKFNSDVAVTNTSFVSRIGNNIGEIIYVDDDFIGPDVDVFNNILDADCSTCFLMEADVADPFNPDQNLYEHGGTNWVDINTTTYTEATLISTYDTSGSDTGDPDFTTESPSSDKYLMLEPGSPGIGLGDPSNLYGGADLLGYPFNATTPNAGARSQRIQIKAGIEWFSDLDGRLGEGADLATILSPGRHLITALARNEDGLSDTDQIRVVVKEPPPPPPPDPKPPVVNILQPKDGAIFDTGDSVELEATVH